ncbi:MAG: ABC transporter permease, partial [Candidatus Aminicenantes bacterium]|nr:ABC transporter permease [Candidatus Aminicenantes bacterium]
MNKLSSPQKKVLRFLLRFIAWDERDNFADYMENVFGEHLQAKGHAAARLWFWGQIIRSLPGLIKKSIEGNIVMLRNYLKTALRKMMRHKGYSFINIAGLAVGIACTMIIFLWMRDEVSYDRFHTKADRIYRVVFSTSEDGRPTNANGSFGVGPALKKDFSEVSETARLRKMEQGGKRYVGYRDNKYYETGFFFAEPSFLTVFDFPLAKGDPATALLNPNAIVLTEETAEKYFGTEDPMGKMIEADPYNDGELFLFQVTGIAQNVPRNSHVHFNFLASYSSLRENTDVFTGFYQHYTYILLNKTSAAETLEPKLIEFLHRNWESDPWYTLCLQPLLDIHLHSNLKSEIEANGNILYVYLFMAIALFVLVIACINFMNLTTARAIKRSREVGIRKVVGAGKGQLVRQFLGESLFFSLISALTALLFIAAALPLFDRLTGKDFDLLSLLNPPFIFGTLGLILFVGFVSGMYPAFVLSSIHPAVSLKSRIGSSAFGILLRKGLVIFQFALAIGIISATLIVQKQMHFIQSSNLGFDKDQILAIPLNKDLRRNYEAVRSELLKYPGIENTTTSSYVPTRGSSHFSFRFEGSEDELSQVVYFVDRDFIETYGIKLMAGENIQSSRTEDGAIKMLVSELSTKEAGYAFPSEAVGKNFTIDETRGYIAGVVNDVTLYSLHRQPYSISYIISPIERHNFLSLRVSPKNLSETLAVLQTTWQRMIPAYPLDYFFLDES